MSKMGKNTKTEVKKFQIKERLFVVSLKRDSYKMVDSYMASGFFHLIRSHLV